MAGNFFTEFLTRSPYFYSVSRNASLDYLEPVTRKAVAAILQEAAASGWPLMLFESYRSVARQKFLFQQGATQLSDVGVHHYGLAADLVRDVNGQPVWDGDYAPLGRLAAQHGLVWGGNWVHFPDLGHVQRINVDDQPRLFNGTWFPDPNYMATIDV